MQEKQRQCLLTMRDAIAHHGTQQGNDAYIAACNICSRIPFTDEYTEFDELWNQLLALWRSFTPQKRGSYKSLYKWVEDEIQPPLPTREELTARADAILATVAQEG